MEVPNSASRLFKFCSLPRQFCRYFLHCVPQIKFLENKDKSWH